MTYADTLDFLKKIADNRVLSVWYVACMPGVRPLLQRRLRKARRAADKIIFGIYLNETQYSPRVSSRRLR